MRSQEKGVEIAYEAFDPASHLSGVAGLCRALEWDNFRYDPDLTRRSLTAPGVTTVVAVARGSGEVLGFAQVFGDGVFQAHLGLLAVDEGWHRSGIGRGLVREAFERTGAGRMDLIASDESLGFYRSLKHREQTGFRLYAARGAELKDKAINFGTDGVRGVANRDLKPEDALRLGLAAARAFGGTIAVGRDTRLSGGMLSGALVAGISAGGARVVDLGVIPTPGVAALAPRLGAGAAAVVSASHNPYPDNGIKFFSGEGRKLPLEKEREIEELTAGDVPRPTGEGVGAVEVYDDAAGLYVEEALKRLSPDAGGMKVLLDCANGAAYRAAPEAFRKIGAEVTVVGAEPTGTNINEGCGSTHVGELDASGHDVAFAFDGDADRVLAVDERGGVVDGDKILAILARDLEERDALGGGVVVTVMSNLGFFKAMDAMGIPYVVTPVGDRHVAEEMQRLGASVGGEQSGHVILSEHATTGDGLVTALALLDVMVRSGKPLSELAAVMDVYPQKLINVVVDETSSAKAVAALEVVEGAVAEAEKTLGSQGRILLRPSGTEPVVRVMVEHEDEAVCREVCAEVARVVEAAGREEA